MSLNDVYQLRLTQQFLGQDCINVYWYQWFSGTPNLQVPAQELLNIFDISLWLSIQGFSDENMARVEIRVVNWSDTSDFAVDQTTPTGSVTAGDPMPSNVCATFRSLPGNPGSRYSFKRHSGLSEAVVNGNQLIDTVPGDFANYAIQLGANRQLSGGIVWVPVQVQHSVAGVNTLPAMGTANPIINRTLSGDWTYKLGTQNTRKPGYGS